MRLAILGTRGIPASYGGFETFAEELSTRLAADGVQVTVYCEGTGAGQPDSYRGVSLRFVPTPSLGPFTTPLFDVRSLWDARKRFDVIYVLGYGAAPFCFIPRMYGKRVWLNVDGIEWKRAKWGRLARLYFQLMEYFSTFTPDRVIADAEGIRQHLLRRHRSLPRCTVIPYGAILVEEAPAFDPEKEWNLDRGKYYLMVCRLEPENHVREIIEGFLASQSRLPLVIVGNQRSATDYVNGLLRFESERVRFIGTIFDKSRLQALRYHSLAYFHGHSVGGTNPSLLEAMGCGNLVLAHDNDFNREVLAESGRFFVNAQEIPELITEIESLGEGDRSRQQEQVRDRIRTIYNWESVVSAYRELLVLDARRN